MRAHVMSVKQEFAQQAMAGIAPVGITGLHFAGVAVHDWVAVATGVYVVLQIVYLLPRIWERYTSKGAQCDSDNA